MILTLNAGSSSVKFSLFGTKAGDTHSLARGQVEDLAETAMFHARAGASSPKTSFALQPEGPSDHGKAVQAILHWIEEAFAGARVVAVGHRVVHGGAKFSAPVHVDDAVLDGLKALVPLAPLHQPHNIAGIEAARAVFPDAPQVACFDTAFHAGHPFIVDAFALPRDYYDDGVRRYGFHGLSYEFVARRLRQLAPDVAAARVVIGHLGNGASLCAIKDGRSVATTMGFTALDGLAMGTRCGQIDPGVLLYLMSERGMSADAISDLLYNKSGLKGLSGLTNDMRDLESSTDARAREAIDYFVLRVCRELASLAAVMEGLDAVVFTGGIGENSAGIRQRVLTQLGWMGAALDAQANAAGENRISPGDARVQAFVIKTDEERMIAEHTMDVAGLSPEERAA